MIFATSLIACFARAAVGQTSSAIPPTRANVNGVFPSTNLPAPPFVAGPLQFLTAATYNEGDGTGSDYPFAIADVNGDGKPDLVVTEGFSDVEVLLGNGDGTFQTPQSYSTGLDYTDGITIADVNGDGKLDLVVTGCLQSCSPGYVAVMLGNGDGTFKAGVLYSTGGYLTGGAAAVADVNLDGKPDLVVANACTTSSCTAYGTLGVMLGNGDGTFKNVVTYSTGAYVSQGVVIADVNADGKPDLLVANGCNPNGCDSYDQTHQLGVLLGNGDGSFGSPTYYATGGYLAVSIVVVDLTGDGIMDVVLEDVCTTLPCGDLQDTSIAVLLGNGDGTFQTATNYDSGGVGRQISVADANGDGKLDLIVPGSCEGCNPDDIANIFSLFGNGDGSFEPASILYMIGPYGSINSVRVADVNSDGRPDLVLFHDCNYNDCPHNELELAVLLNNSAAPITTTSLTASENPISLFRTVTYTAKVSGGSGGTIDGTISFADWSNPLATIALSSNQATYSTSYRTAGTHSITATYSGIFHSDGTSRSVALTESVVNPTTTTATTSGSPTYVGQPVTFTAAVSSKYGAIPSGEVIKFYDGSALMSSVALSGGKATYTTSKLTAKTHGIRAVYVGDSNFATSTGHVTQVVQLYSTTTALTCSPNPSASGQTVIMTATVKSSGTATPTGKVTFTDGSTWIGTGILSGGVATISRSNLTVGTHPITATYNGDSNSAGSKSAVVDQVVN